jgi:hypothetical protein
MQLYIVLQESLLEVKLNRATCTTHKLTDKRFDKKKTRQTFSRNACTCACAIEITSKTHMRKALTKKRPSKSFSRNAHAHDYVARATQIHMRKF